ncbi:class I SAM-dependent methyltransferase [Algoriphagus halophytocola]|uniref:Class I SAM-dependent methyltransferase n=1 Tax=Algoriphagus halophytocola TaxID=2991499 RepID=A0ABY6MDB2_9BACT|nr:MULTISPECIES: class I SAM-dependent methyltransferase [unclassified Algoriphagus]UZD21725.1 class I SAM-dependent methyltransferase [Algoriphagus sp. TR-M5]WBL42937.1 class I SAM-dependent methyltransferase [Algoriphagus sp. TR-M9]
MSFITDLFSPSENPRSLGAKFRNQRQKDFEDLFFKNFSKTKPVRILDLGGTDYFWKNSALLDLPNVEITLLNLSLDPNENDRFKAVVGDATSMPQFPDQSFDLIFSNSVIEHLYTWENQQKMAAEILRVGKKHFIQTPNKHFPIEAHYAIPFSQYVPKSWVFFFLTKTKVSRLQKWDPAHAQQYLDEIRLLTLQEMKKLFPGSSIYKESWLGMTKSICAHNLG